MPKRPTTDPEALAEITRLAGLGYSATDILRVLQADARFQGDAGVYRGPALRTIQDHVRRLRPLDTSGPWSLAGASGESAGFVLDTLAAAIEESDGRVRSLTVAEAEWISAIHRARLDLEPTIVWYLARSSIARTTHGEPTDDLDAFLAFAPWRDEEARARYIKAIAFGDIRAAALLLLPYLIRERRGRSAGGDDDGQDDVQAERHHGVERKEGGK